MSRKITVVLFVFVFLTAQVFADDFGFSFLPYFGAVTEDEVEIPQSIRNNEFYVESLRLTKLAQDTYEYGDYDASAGFAEEAIRYAERSDEYVAGQLVAEAKRLLDWADANNIAKRYPADYAESKDSYDTSVAAHSNEKWDEAINAASRTINILAAFESGAGRKAPLPKQYTVRTWATVRDCLWNIANILAAFESGAGRKAPLPKQYTVRTWATVRDCLWNIAGYPWVYGEPRRWRTLYEANKSKLPNPDNPNLINPGMVLDIPSINNEARQGMWDSSKTYR